MSCFSSICTVCVYVCSVYTHTVYTHSHSYWCHSVGWLLESFTLTLTLQSHTFSERERERSGEWERERERRAGLGQSASPGRQEKHITWHLLQHRVELCCTSSYDLLFLFFSLPILASHTWHPCHPSLTHTHKHTQMSICIHPHCQFCVTCMCWGAYVGVFL